MSKPQAPKDRILSAAKRGPVGAGMARRGASGSGFHTPRKYGKRDRQWTPNEGGTA